MTKDVMVSAEDIKNKGKGQSVYKLGRFCCSTVHVFALLHKEQKPSYTVSLDDLSCIKDMRWRKKYAKSYLILSENGKLYHGSGPGPLSCVMESVDSGSKWESPKASVPKTKLEVKIIETMRRREIGESKMKSFNSVILKFPKIDECLKKCKVTFQEFDENGNGIIDVQELKYCFRKLEIRFTDEKVDDLFVACDINEDKGMNFNEFVVLLCLVYLLKDDPSTQPGVSFNLYIVLYLSNFTSVMHRVST